ncbi:MAG: hypothetical protein AAFP90_19450, partial [Planctomycetota bacterium]
MANSPSIDVETEPATDNDVLSTDGKTVDTAVFESKITDDLSVYTELSPKIRKRVVQYLVHGTDATVLLDLPAEYQKKGRKQFFKEGYGGARFVDNKDGSKMRTLLERTHVTEDYYPRLAEFMRRIPELAAGVNRLVNLDGVPDWLFVVIAANGLFSGNAYGYLFIKQALIRCDLRRLIPQLRKENAIVDIVRAMFHDQITDYSSLRWGLLYSTGLDAMIDEAPDTFAAALLASNANTRAETLTWLESTRTDLAPLLPSISEVAVSGSKTARPPAMKLLSREEHRDAAAPLILQFLQSKKASQRNEAAEILPELIGEDARAALEQSLETEKGKRVQQTIRRELQNLDHANTAAAGGGDDPGNDAGDSDPHWQPITLPPLAVPTQVPPLPGGFETAFRNAIAQSTEKAEKHYKQQLAHFNGPDRPRWMRQPTKPSLITDDEIN